MANTLQSILTEAGLALAPLRAVNTPQRAVAFFRQLGYEIPLSAFGGALSALATKAEELITSVRQLAQASSDAGIALAVADVLVRLGAAVDAIGQLHTEVKLGGGGALPNIGDLPRRLTDFLVLDYLNIKRPNLHAELHLLGLVEHETSPAPTQSTRLINWDRFGQFLSEPQRIADDVYQWSTNVDTGKLLARLETFMRAAVLPGGIYPQSETMRNVLGNAAPALPELRFPIFQKGLTPETYTQFGITFSPVEAQGGKKAGIALLPYLRGTANFDFDVCDRGQLTFESSADIKGVGLILRPPFEAEGILNLTAGFHASVQIHEKPAQAKEMILLGTAGGTRLAVQGLGITWFAQTVNDKLDLGARADIDALRLVIGGGDGDGFLQKILSGLNLQAEAKLAFGMSLLSGFTFQGGAKFALEVGVNVDLGPVSIPSIRLAVTPSGDQFGLDAGVLLKCDLGPFKAVVEDLGLHSAIHFRQGNLGPADLEVSFKPPIGIGLSLDTGVIKGGGYLRFDPAQGEYAGALELTFSEIIALKAIGIITTKLPDGGSGFALLILVTAEFVPLQLGFGFTLVGVGGLLALNRTLDTDALKVGVRTGAVNSILFPQDIVANIGRIISDLKTIFPIAQEHFIIGPMGKLGWGTPTLISLELGVILDIPKPQFTLLGVLRCILPTEEADILKLQVNFAGGIDFNRGLIWFDASLFDSRLLVYTLTGDMALRIGWGDEPLLVISVGGFHPAFREIPSDLRGMRRITISLLSGENPRIAAETYFAITSNTVQSGSRVELYAEACGLNIYGFLGYDLLVQFNPFFFLADIAAGLALRDGTDVLMGIDVHCQLSGPTPWHARGEASIDVLFFSVSVDFNVTWGDDTPSLPEQTVDVYPLVRAALGDDRNWRATLPANTHQSVTLRKIDISPDHIVLQPFAVLEVSQKVVPLGLEINKFGNQRPTGVTNFDVTFSGGSTEEAREEFARANFVKLKDDEKLALKSFEKLRSGLRFTTGDSSQYGTNVQKDVTYELSYVYRKRRITIRAGLYQLLASVFSIFSQGGAIANHAYAIGRRVGGTPPARIVVKEPDYMVVNMSDLNLHAPNLVAKTETEAYQLHDQLLAADPSLRGKVQVLSSYELN
jgi:hypothetical protein